MASQSRQSNTVKGVVSTFRHSTHTRNPSSIRLVFDKYDGIISKEEKKIQEVILDGVGELDPNYSARNRMFAAIDKMMYSFINDTESEKNRAALNKAMTEAGKLSYIPTPDPLVLGRSEDLIAYITDVFIMRDPVFDVPPIPQKLHVSTAIEDFFRKQSQVHKWRPTLTKAVQNSVWYNFGPAMLDSFNSEDSLKITALSPFNTRYDNSVRLEDVAEKAMMAATSESVSVVEIMENLNLISPTYLTNWGKKCKNSPEYILKANELFEGLPLHVCNKYNRSNETDSYMSGGYARNWDHISEEGLRRSNIEDAKDSISKVTRTVIYRRLQPSWFNLNTKVYSDDESGKTPVYRFLYVNGTLLSIEPTVNAPYIIPMYIGSCHLDTESEIPYTFSERLNPLQNYNDKLNDARLKGVKDSLSLLEVMDDDLIEEMNEDGVKTLRIKSKARKDQGFSIEQAYKQYRPDTQGITGILSFQRELQSMVTNATGDGRMLQGEHIPGNRTAPESSRILKTSEARVVLRSFAIQATLIEPLQQDIQKRLASKTNLLRYYEPITGELTAVTNKDFQLARHFFEISDGLLPSSLNVSPDAAQSLITMVVQIPALQQMFDLKTLTQLFASSMGLKGVSKIPTPSAAQQEIQQRLQDIAAAAKGPTQGQPQQSPDGQTPTQQTPPQQPNLQGQPGV